MQLLLDTIACKGICVLAAVMGVSVGSVIVSITIISVVAIVAFVELRAQMKERKQREQAEDDLLNVERR